ncbi:MAG: hypothetical protein PHO54_00420, partial [Candidatus Peribacteraceae bacterium]|nr:hypothetical protein [Candidatus Peribacteraceae bacterium]
AFLAFFFVVFFTLLFRTFFAFFLERALAMGDGGNETIPFYARRKAVVKSDYFFYRSQKSNY